MRNQQTSKFIRVYKSDLSKIGDLGLALWYSAVKDYCRRFKKDKKGFSRVPSSLFREDFGFDRNKVWRYNKRLEELGLIRLDSVSRGGRTWVGIKLL